MKHLTLLKNLFIAMAKAQQEKNYYDNNVMNLYLEYVTTYHKDIPFIYKILFCNLATEPETEELIED